MVQKWEKRWKKEMMIMLNIRERGGEEPPGNGGVWWGKCPKNDGGKPLGWGLLWLKMGGKRSKEKEKRGGGVHKNNQKNREVVGNPPGVGAVVKKRGKMVKNETAELRAEVDGRGPPDSKWVN